MGAFKFFLRMPVKNNVDGYLVGIHSGDSAHKECIHSCIPKLS